MLTRCVYILQTKYLIFRPPRTNLNLNVDQNGRSFIPIFLKMNNPNEHDITKIIQIKLLPNPDESSAKLLGVSIDEKLNFNPIPRNPRCQLILRRGGGG